MFPEIDTVLRYAADVLDGLKNYGPAITSVMGPTVAWLLYRHAQYQRNDKWLDHFKEIHGYFWKEPELAKVRKWIACKEAYDAEVQPVLLKRRGSGGASASDYAVLEALDHFLNLLGRVTRLQPENLPSHRKFAEVRRELFFSYWLKESTDGTRLPELRWYIKTFYGHLLKQADAEFGYRPYPEEPKAGGRRWFRPLTGVRGSVE